MDSPYYDSEDSFAIPRDLPRMPEIMSMSRAARDQNIYLQTKARHGMCQCIGSDSINTLQFYIAVRVVFSEVFPFSIQYYFTTDPLRVRFQIRPFISMKYIINLKF